MNTKGESMDALVLTFTPEQHKKYLELIDCEQIELNFDIKSPEFEVLFYENINVFKRKIISSCTTLLEFNKHTSFFSKSLKKEEINNLIPIYYKSICDISSIKQEMYNNSIIIAKQIDQLEKAYMTIAKQYSSFLPYKAAFGKREQYRNTISDIDNKFSIEFDKINECKRTLICDLGKISTACDKLIPEFFSSISCAADAPKFENFESALFFNTILSFEEKLKLL